MRNIWALVFCLCSIMSVVLLSQAIGPVVGPGLNQPGSGQGVSENLDFTNAVGVWGMGPDPGANNIPWWTQRRNFLLWSEALDTSFTTTRASYSANSTTNPIDGTQTAEKFVEDNSSSTSHLASIPATGTNGQTFTFSVYAKAGERSWIRLSLQDATLTRAWFNLAAGSVGTVEAGITAGVSSLSSGWYRISITRTINQDGIFTLLTHLTTADNTTNYSGDGSSGLYIWGAQLNLGSTATPYEKTTDGQRVWDFSPAASHLQPGSTSGADTNDPAKVMAGYDFTVDDFLVGPSVAVKTVVVIHKTQSVSNSYLVDLRPGFTNGYIFNGGTDSFGPAWNAYYRNGISASMSDGTQVFTNTWEVSEIVSNAGGSGVITIGARYSLDTGFATESVACVLAYSDAQSAGQAAIRYRVLVATIGIPRGLNLPAPTAYFRWEERILATALPFVDGPLAFDPLGVRQ